MRVAALLSVVLATTAACNGKFTGDADAGALPVSSGGVPSGGGSSSSGAGGSSSGGGGSSSSSGAPADTSCQGQRIGAGPFIAPATADGAPAAATGGTLGDGTYVLDSVTLYDASSVVGFGGFKQTIVVTGAHYLRLYEIETPVYNPSGSVAGTWAVDGTRLTQRATCSDGDTDSGSGPFAGDYSATATDLRIVQPSPYDDDWTAELHFVKE